MVQVQQRVLGSRRALDLVTVALFALALLPVCAAGATFYADDPLWQEPPPRRVEKPRVRNLNDYYDFFRNTFFAPGREALETGSVPPAGGVNTLGEVPDSSWYTNRHPEKMTIRELVRAAGDANAPSAEGPWIVISCKEEGVTPGFVIRDARGRSYVLKLDPSRYPELTTGAEVVGSKFFWALGYNVPENYIVHFTRNQLEVDAKSTLRDYRGKERRMTREDIDDLLRKAPRDKKNGYRAAASMIVPGELIGPFRYHGVRADDPNDVVPHQHRRDLRGLSVFAAWLNHTDSKSLNTLDTVVEENEYRYVKHYLIDFGAVLGSDTFEPKSPRAGNMYLFDFKPAAAQFLSLGLYIPDWHRAEFPEIPGVGNLEYRLFDPLRWKPNYPNPAFDHRLPDDAFWAAKKVMAFTDEQIRALAAAGRYTDPRAADYIARALAARRDKIGRAFFEAVLPLDRFAVRGGRLVFEDLAVKHGFTDPRAYRVAWSSFDNESGRTAPLPGTTFELPEHLSRRGAYAAASIHAGDPAKWVIVYVRNRGGRAEVVGIDRKW